MLNANIFNALLYISPPTGLYFNIVYFFTKIPPLRG